VEQFKKAWQAFEGYRPFQRVHADSFWYYGRKATRFWLDEIDPGTPESDEVCDFLEQQLAGWAPDGTTAFGQGTKDDLLFNSEQSGNLINATMAIVEQTISIRETRAKAEAPPAGVGKLADPLKMVETFPAMLGVVGAGSGEPEFDLTKGGLYCQLLGRIHLLEAQVPSLAPAERLALVEKGVSLVGKSKEPDIIFDSFLSAGQICRQLGRSDLAIANWKQALTFAESLGYLERATEASSLLAKEYSQLGKLQEAMLYADKASTNVEARVGLVAGDATATRKLAESSEQVTEVSVKAAFQAEDPERALAAVVRGKEAQSATARMSGQGEAQVEVTSVAKREQEVTTLAVQVKTLESMPASPTRDELLKSTQKLLAETKAEFLLKSREIRQKYPDLYSRVLKFDPLDLPGVQKVLPAEAAVIQYFPTDDGLYVFLVTRESFRLRSVPITEKELDDSVATFVRGVRRAQQGDSKLEKDSKALYAALIEPCQADLEGKSILVLIPTGRLNILPFACLTAPSGASLIESKLILELAQPTDFMRIFTTPPIKVESVVAFANATEDLPAAAKEGDQIAAMFPGAKLFKGKEASKQNFLDFGADAQILHLATHGESNSENSLTNYLRMSGNEKVAQEEIFSMTLDKTSIVTLSACNTAVGDNLDSKFVASLAEAFWLGGSQSVIASLWAVNDESTGLLMTEFYQGLRAGKSKALALKDAQLKVKSTPGFEHPYFWAGFLLFGDWR
jgi:CHAT domain-containing protein